MVIMTQGCHSNTPADKQINKEMIHPTSKKHNEPAEFCKEIKDRKIFNEVVAKECLLLF